MSVGEILVLITFARNECLDEPAQTHQSPLLLAYTIKVWKKLKIQDMSVWTLNGGVYEYATRTKSYVLTLGTIERLFMLHIKRLTKFS